MVSQRNDLFGRSSAPCAALEGAEEAESAIACDQLSSGGSTLFDTEQFLHHHHIYLNGL